MWIGVCIGMVSKRELFPGLARERQLPGYSFEKAILTQTDISQMPILGIFDVKPPISGSWRLSPTARPWAEIKERWWAAGRWDHKKPFLRAQQDEQEKGSGRQGASTSQRAHPQKRRFFCFSLGEPVSPVFQPTLSTIHWEAPFFSSLLSQDAESIVLLWEGPPTLQLCGLSSSRLAEFGRCLLKLGLFKFEGSFALFFRLLPPFLKPAV